METEINLVLHVKEEMLAEIVVNLFLPFFQCHFASLCFLLQNVILKIR